MVTEQGLHWPECLLCGEEGVPDLMTRMPYVHTVEGETVSEMRSAHRECVLRQATGGIGHLVAHNYWCNEKHDPDAGLTPRQSALLAAAWVRIVGSGPLTGEDDGDAGTHDPQGTERTGGVPPR